MKNKLIYLFVEFIDTINKKDYFGDGKGIAAWVDTSECNS